jgi:hypothetical protein
MLDDQSALAYQSVLPSILLPSPRASFPGPTSPSSRPPTSCCCCQAVEPESGDKKVQKHKQNKKNFKPKKATLEKSCNETSTRRE